MVNIVTLKFEPIRKVGQVAMAACCVFALSAATRLESDVLCLFTHWTTGFCPFLFL